MLHYPKMLDFRRNMEFENFVFSIKSKKTPMEVSLKIQQKQRPCNILRSMLHGRELYGGNQVATTQPIRNKQQIRELAGYYLKCGEIRNYVLIVMGVHTALRISDLLRLKWEHVYDFEHKRVRESVTLTERKTGKVKTIALNKQIIAALTLYAAAAKRGVFLIKSRKGGAISRIQAYRLIRGAAEALGFRVRVSCHSLRKTFGYHAWKSGAAPVVIMEIYNHSSFAVTKRYLGVSQEDKDEVYLSLEILD
jgi:integrase